MSNPKMKQFIEPVIETVKSLPWDDKAFYMEYLAQAYHYVFHSTRMLAAAASVCTPMQKEFYNRCIEHLKEEAGHDQLAITDLKRLGGKIEDYPESGVTRAFWEPQFYKIQRSPTQLLGYILLLEYQTILAGPIMLETLRKTYGDKCSNFIRVHVQDDADHVEQAVKQIEAMTPQEQKEIWDNYEQTAEVYCLFLKECYNRSRRSLKVKASA